MMTAVGGPDIVDLAKRHKELREELRQVDSLIERIINAPPTNPQRIAPAGVTNGNGYAVKSPAPLETLNVNGSKSKFIQSCFRNNPGTNPKDIDILWKKKGGKGVIHPSQVYQIKRDMVTGGAKKMAAAPRKVKAATAVVEPTNLREVVWALLSKQPMSVVEIVAAIQEENLVTPLPRKLNDHVKAVLKELRESDKVKRGDKLRYGITQGATLD